MSPCRRQHRRSLYAAFSVAALMVVCGSALGQARPDPLDITGRDFAGIRLPLAPSSDDVSFAAQRAWAWQEGGVRRLALVGDVSVRMGGFRFEAARAVVWMQRLDETHNGRPVHQVFVYFDRVATPTASPSVAVSADRLPVEGVVAPARSIQLAADRLDEGRPTDRSLAVFVRDGERELADHLRRTLGLPALRGVVRRDPEVPGTTIRPGVDRPFDPESEVVPPDRVTGVLEALPPETVREPIFADNAVISFSAGDITIVTGEEENAVILSGGVAVFSQEQAGGKTLQIAAERAVVFLPPGEIASLGGLRPDQIRGIYLEGGVTATDGQYSIRGPRVYYDIAEDRAIILDAVFWTFDAARSMPLYLRAAAIRQESSDQFRAERIRLANTGFARPHLSIGADRVTLTRSGGGEEIIDEDGSLVRQGETYHAKASNITLRAADVPFFYWPGYSGDPTAFPLRRIAFTSSGATGDNVRTGWDFGSLLGIDTPDEWDVELLVDAYFNRGDFAFGLGLDTSWEYDNLRGELFGYILPEDDGIDFTRTGARRFFDDETRGMVLGEQRWDLADGWTLWAEVGYVSDETFVDSFFDELGTNRRDLLTGGVLARTRDNTQLAIEARGSLNDFPVNEYTLQTPGYVVEKLPEVRYLRLADDLLPQIEPGLLTYFSEYRAGILRQNFADPIVSEFGYTFTSASQAAFGIDPNESIADRLRREGYTSSSVARLDTRHELVGSLKPGVFNINPFVIGRVTHWDERFEEFSPDEREKTRWWGAAGLRIGTTISKVNDEAESRLLDIHRMRHIIEPSVTVMHAATTIDRGDIPVFDNDVENLIEGTIFRFGLDQTWQTRRGGPGRWRTVDVFRLNSEVVISEDTGENAVIGRYFQDRPELSRPGDFARVEGVWQATDAISFAGETIYDFDTNQQARSSAGVLIDHSPLSSTSIEFRYINPIDSTRLDAMTSLLVSDKYALVGSTSYDVDGNDFLRFTGIVRREFADLFFGFSISYDNIRDTTSVGIVLQPKGFRGRGLAVQGIGSSQAGGFGAR
ncbi:MAG: hypothetical protein JJU33_12995 [Phycisphaerales bacterium]|nr:hypothetical protein [Phycisphaerales bacterium]